MPVCGLKHDISQCKKEEAGLNAKATKRGGKIPGAAKSNKFEFSETETRL